MDDLKSALPYPIAYALSRLDRRLDRPEVDAGGGDAVVALHEAIARTLGVLALASYLSEKTRVPALDHHLRGRFFAHPATAADWAELARLVLASTGVPQVPELSRFFETDGQAILRFAALAHDERRAALEKALAALAFLGDYDVLVPLRVMGAGRDGDELRVTEAVRARGPSLSPAPASFRALAALAPLRLGEDVLLVKGGAEILRLSPLVVADLGTLDDADDLYFFEHTRPSRLDYLGVRPGAKRSIAAGSVHAGALAAVHAAFGGFLSRSAADEDVSLGATFRGMNALVDEAARGVVGRDAVIEELGALASSAGNGALVIVSGPPGAGKTSTLAAFVRSGKVTVSAVHLAGPDAGRDDPRLVARALAAQLCERFALRRPIPDEEGAAMRLLLDLLRELGEAGERVVVVLDGLDELSLGPASAPGLAVLPGAVPKGVCLVVSAKPSPALDSVARQHGARRIDLPTLPRQALVQIARALSPEQKEAELVRAVISSEGNPLFLRVLLALGQKEPGDTLPATLDAAFEEAAARLAKSPDVDGARALGLLAVARSGLSRRDLAELLSASPFAVAAFLRDARGFVAQRGGRLFFVHAALEDWVTAHAPARPRLHADVAALLDAQVDSGRVDALSDLVFHLAAGVEREALLARVSGVFAAKKAAALGPESLRADLVRAAEAAGKDLVRASHHALSAALLSRGAEALARAGVVTAIARAGAPAIAASLARAIPDAKEREQALLAVAVAVAPRSQREALAVCDEIEGSRREAAIAQVKATPPAGASSPPASGGDVSVAAADVLSSAGRGLRARAVAAAARGMAPEPAKKLVSRTTGDVLAETSAEVRDVLVAELAGALAKVDAKEAAMIAEGLPRGLGRVRALAAAGDAAQALAEAVSMAEGEPREAALAEALEAMAPVDAAEASAHLGELTSPLHRDRVRAALARATRGALTATKIESVDLRVETLARIGEWEEAEAVASAEEPPSRAAAYERMASAAATTATDSSRVERYEALAATAMASILEDVDRASAYRKAALLAATDRAAYALRALARAAALDTSYEGTRETLLRRAEIDLAHPSYERVEGAISVAASYGHAFADLFPGVVRAVAAAIGQSHPADVAALLSAIESSEKAVAALLASGLPGAIKSAPPSLGPAARAALEDKWPNATAATAPRSSAPTGAPSSPPSAPPPSRSLTPPKDAIDEAWGDMDGEPEPDTTREEATVGKPPWVAPVAPVAPVASPAPSPPAVTAPPPAPISEPPQSLVDLPRLGGDDDDELREEEFTAVMNRDQQKELREAIRAQKVVSLREEREREDALRRASEPDPLEVQNKPTLPPPSARTSERGDDTPTTKPPPSVGEATTTKPPPGGAKDSGSGPVSGPALAPPRMPSFTSEAEAAERKPRPTSKETPEKAAPSPKVAEASAADTRRTRLVALIVVLAIIFLVLVVLSVRAGK